MRKSICYLFFMFHLIAFGVNAQQWTTIPKASYFSASPHEQFTYSPYSNTLWCVGYNNVATITEDGIFTNYTYNELGPISINQNQKFVFTSNDIFYIRDSYGLYSFNNEVSTSVYPNFTDFTGFSTNLDTMYIVLNTPNFTKKYINGMVSDFGQLHIVILAKDTFYYFSDGTSYVGYNIDGNPGNSVYLSFNDPDFLQGLFHDVKYTRLTDSLYVGGNKGISIAYNYDFIDTITPNNTTNMPSSRVLEMEFDLDDNLWAVFGDANDDGIALARLDGTNWTDIYTSSNCAIDFSTFIGMEIDTLGTIWVVDNDNLHALTNANSPAWLSNFELEKESIISISPNPANEVLTFQSPDLLGSKVQIVDVNGKVIFEKESQNQELNIATETWQEGLYFVKLTTDDGRVLNSKVEVIH